MNQNESIEKIYNYFADYKEKQLTEKEGHSVFFNKIMEGISFKKKFEKMSFNTELNKVEILYYPIDIETMRENFKYDYKVMYDNNSNKFNTLICGSKNILIQYISLLPKKYKLSPIGIVILRLCSDKLEKYNLSTDIIKEETHGIYFKKFYSYSVFGETKPIDYSKYSSRVYSETIINYLSREVMNYAYHNIEDVFIDLA